MNISTLAAAAFLAAVIGTGAQSLAQTTTAPATAARPSGASLGIPELVDRLSRDGYREINEVKRKSDKLYEVTARDAQGRKLEMKVDARTAEVLESEQDDDK
jgi:hypothetical protein